MDLITSQSVLAKYGEKPKGGVQEEAFRIAKEKNHSRIIKWGSFAFMTVKDDDELSSLIYETEEDQRCFFEVIRENEPQFLFTDIDGEFSKLPEGSTVESILFTMIPIIQEAFEKCNLGKFKKNKLRILSASNDAKLSLHISYYDDKCFENCEAQKQDVPFVFH